MLRPPFTDPPAVERAPPERVVVFQLRSVLTGIVLVLAAVAAVKIVVLAKDALTLIVLAAFFALALNPGVACFQRRGLSRGWAVAAVYAVAFAVVTCVALVLVPPLVTEITRFLNALPDLVGDLTKGRGPLGSLETRYHVVEHVRQATSGGAGLLGEASSAVTALHRAATTAFGLVVIAFLTLFMLLEGPEWRRRALALTPGRSRPAVERIGAGVYRCVAGFVTGNLVAAILAGVVATAIMLVSGVPYAVPLGLFVVIVELAPFVGPVLATAVVTAVALTRGTTLAVVVLVLLVAYHAIESHAIRPLLYGRAVALSPLSVLVAMLLGVEIAGILGVLVAIPIAGTVNVVVGEVLASREARSAAP